MEKEAHQFYSAAEQKKCLLPLLHIFTKLYQKDKTAIIGISGGQGTGKTTLSRYLQEELRKKRYHVESFSLDDFYTSYQERQQLALKYPDNLFYQISRGMPGTHRIKELAQTLKNIKKGKHFIVPVFDKSLRDAYGDIAGEKIITKKQDFVFLEGWCVGLPKVSGNELKKICKKKRISLPSGYEVMLGFLKSYQPIWKYIDYLVMLRPVSIGLHLKWRRQQEQELQQRTGRGMSEEEVRKFVDIYLPLTYAGYGKIKADAVLRIDKGHRLVGFSQRKA